MDNSLQDKVYQYLQGNMTAEEEVSFVEEMRTNKALVQEYMLQKSLQLGLNTQKKPLIEAETSDKRRQEAEKNWQNLVLRAKRRNKRLATYFILAFIGITLGIYYYSIPPKTGNIENNENQANVIPSTKDTVQIEKAILPPKYYVEAQTITSKGKKYKDSLTKAYTAYQNLQQVLHKCLEQRYKGFAPSKSKGFVIPKINLIPMPQDSSQQHDSLYLQQLVIKNRKSLEIIEKQFKVLADSTKNLNIQLEECKN